MANFNLGKIRLKWRGAWAAANTFFSNDLAIYSGSTYICLTDNLLSGTNPFADTANWQLFAQSALSQNTTRGDITVRASTGVDVRLPLGASGSFLTSNGLDPLWQSGAFRTNDVFAQMAHMGDVGLGTYVWAAVTADKRQIRVAGRNGLTQGALVQGNDIADYNRNAFGTAQMFPRLDVDDFIVDLAVGYYNIACVTNKGYVYTGGANNFGQLGHGDTVSRPFLKRVEYFVTTNVQQITKVYLPTDGGFNFNAAFFLTASGQVWGAGYNLDGGLGNATVVNQSTPVRAGTLTGITGLSVSGTYASVYAWNAAGQLYVWGRNSDYGQLGIGNVVNQSAPVASLTNVKKVVSVSSNYFNGTNHTTTMGAYAIALKNDGTVWGTGSNTQGQLGVGDATVRNAWTQATTAPVATDVFIGGGGYYGQTFAINAAGFVFGCGYNFNGSLSLGNTTQSNVFVQPILPTGAQGTISRVVSYAASRVTGSFFVSASQNKAWFAGSPLGAIHCNLNASAIANITTAVEVMLPPNVVIKDIWCADVRVDGTFEGGAALWILSTAGELYAAGDNTYGQTGDFLLRVQGTLRGVIT